ncbi:trehalose-6-phosphate synthase [bacterium]|nr:trehalose-6-phosphate synthase [bacterium]
MKLDGRDGRLVIVSNRLPVLSSADGAAAAGGLVAAVRPAIEGAGSTLWFGWSGSVPDGAPSARESEPGSLRVIPVELSQADSEGYYNGFCNGALWPLLHSFPGRFRAEARDYESYRRANAAFARTLVRHLRANDRVWVHDFHLVPLALELRERGFPGAIGFFLHVPFPSNDIFTILPWARELLEALLAYDLIGFQTPDYVENYERCVERALPGALPRRAAAFPIGIDPAPFQAWSEEPGGIRKGKDLRRALQGRKLIVGVDRLDYTKGLVERLKVFERLLENHARWRGHVSYIQISAPTRTRVPEYAAQKREVEELVGRVNGRFGDPDWMPLRYIFRSYGQRELAAYYREADVCLVTPLRDGMNLVASEYVAAQTGDPGVLVLSRFAGAASVLEHALIVNPYDADACARTLDRALSMPLEERARRQAALLACVHERTAARWAESFLAALEVAHASGQGRETTRRVRSPAKVL